MMRWELSSIIPSFHPLRVLGVLCVSLSILQSEMIPEFAVARGSNRKGPAIKFLRHPFLLERKCEKRCSQGAADMGPPFTPIEACKCESSAQCSGALNIYADFLKRLRTSVGEIVGIILF